MIQSIIFDRLIRGSAEIALDNSRCSKTRFNKSGCNLCLENCPPQALKMDGQGISINQELCTSCMLCVSSCPAGCFELKNSWFFSLLLEVKHSDSPLIGCNPSEDPGAQAKSHCLGYLSEEHLLFLAVFSDRTVGLNLTTCRSCANGFIVDRVKSRIARLGTNFRKDISQKILILEDESQLNYPSSLYKRRDFFKIAKDQVAQKTFELFSKKETGSRPYAGKSLPFRRILLNRVFSSLKDQDKKKLLQAYYYDLSLNKSCDFCFVCTAICPTAALKKEAGKSASRLTFNTSLCTGCRLCVDICPGNGVRLDMTSSGK